MSSTLQGQKWSHSAFWGVIPPPDQAALRDRMKDFEARLIRDALARANSNRAAAAKLLGIPLRTFNHKKRR
jgi:transcriptional regulator with PAS, ATPase and Fis domain